VTGQGEAIRRKSARRLSESGAYNTVKARLCPRLSGQRPYLFPSCPLVDRKRAILIVRCSAPCRSPAKTPPGFSLYLSPSLSFCFSLSLPVADLRYRRRSRRRCKRSCPTVKRNRTYKTAKARFCPWLSGKSPKDHFKLFCFRYIHVYTHIFISISIFMYLCIYIYHKTCDVAEGVGVGVGGVVRHAMHHPHVPRDLSRTRCSGLVGVCTTLKPGPKTGLDCLTCAIFARDWRVHERICPLPRDFNVKHWLVPCCRTSLSGVPREQKILKQHLLRVICHRVY